MILLLMALTENLPGLSPDSQYLIELIVLHYSEYQRECAYPLQMFVLMIQ